MSTIKEYTNEDVTVVWKPDLCIHSQKCFKGLSEVFDPKKRPWITPEGASTEQIVAQVNKCPSGALSIKGQEGDTSTRQSLEIEVVKDGPIMINQEVTIRSAQGTETRPKVALCRCGASANKPFCDGSHKKVGFSG